MKTWEKNRQNQNHEVPSSKNYEIRKTDGRTDHNALGAKLEKPAAGLVKGAPKGMASVFSLK